MNAMLNIQIRVLGQQAAAQLKMMQSQLNTMQRSTGQAGRALGGFGGNMNTLTNRMERFGKNIQWSGRQLEYNFTLPLVLAGAAATKWALENEKSMVRVRKVYGQLGEDTTAELEALEKSFTLLSNRFGVHKAEVQGIAAAWAQAGAAGVALAKATRTTLEAMILGDFGAEDAVQKMIAVQSAYRLNTDQLAQALANLNAVENQTSINLGGLVEVITRAGGAARASGFELGELAAMASVLVPAAGSASQAGNSLRTMMSRLMAPTRQATQILNEMGLAINETAWLSSDGQGRFEQLAVAFHGLTQNQKAVVSSTVASRWQINRFNLLMEDMYLSLDPATRALSSIAIAQDAMGDGTEANAIKQRELLEVLKSTPRAFAILTTNIKNSMAEAILPLLPAMVSLLKGVADLVKGFTNLPESTKKLIITFAVLLAIIGPLGRYIGSLGILFGTLGHAWHGLLSLGGGLIRVFFGMTAAQTANLTVSELENASFLRKHGLIGGLARIIAGPFVLAYKGLIAVMALTSGAALGLAGHLGHGIYTALRVFTGGAIKLVGGLATYLMVMLPRAAAVGVSGMGAALRSLPLIFAAAGQGVLAAMAAMRAGMVAIFRTLPILAAATGRGMGLLLTGAFGKAAAGFGALVRLAIANPFILAKAAVIIAVVSLGIWLIKTFRDDIINGIIQAFNGLPAGIKNALVTVVRMIQTFARTVHEWLSYLNPFARHSPSLVDNVTRGVTTILDQYGRLYGVKNVLREAIAAHQAFLSATGAASRNLQMEEFKMKRADIVAVSPGAGPSVDRLISSIFRMKAALASVNDEVVKQSRLVYDLEKSLEGAMKPYTDAIAKNKRQQDELRLAMLKLERDGGGSLDDLKKRYAALNGQIEMFTGQREDLRLAGAGSEITGPINSQIKALEEQRKAMEGQTAPLDKMRKEMEELQREGEILQLETSLKFDPQIAELDAQKDKLREIETAYRDIEAAIRDMESALNSLASDASAELSRREAAKKASDAADKLPKEPSIPVAIADFRAGGMADFEVPGGEAPPGLGREGGLAEIEDFNAALEAEIEQMMRDMGGFDFFQPFRDMWDTGWKWMTDNVWPYIEPFYNKVLEAWRGIDWKNLWGDLGDMFSGLGENIENSRLSGALERLQGWFGTAKDFITNVWSLLWPVIDTVVTQIWQSLQSLGGELKNWAPLWDDLKKAVGRAIDGIRAVIIVTLAAIMGLWVLFWPAIREVAVAIWNFLTAFIRGALETLRGVITVILAAINGDWSRAWEGLLTIIDGVWDMIFAVFRGAWDIIYGIVRGLVEGIVKFFKWLYNVLVGNSIIPDMVNAIVKVFRFLADVVTKIWDALWTAVVFIWNRIMKPLFDAIVWAINNLLIPAFNFLRDGISKVWDAIGTAIRFVWNSVIKPLWDGIKWYIDNQLIPAFHFFRDKGKAAFEAIGNGLKWVWDNLLRPIFTSIIGFIETKVAPAFHWLASKIGDAWGAIRSMASSAWNGILGIIGSAVNKAIDIVNKLIDGINLLGKLPGININIKHIGHVSWGTVGGGGGGGTGGTTAGGNFFNAQGTNRIPEHPFARQVGGGFKTNNVRAIVGEGNPLYPEYVIPTDPNFRNRAMGLAGALLNDLGLNNFNELHPQYAGGGNVPMYFMGGILDLAGDAWDATGGKVASGIKKGAAMAIFGPVNEAAKALINMIPFQLARETGHMIRETMYNWVKGTDDKVPEAPAISPLGGGMVWQQMWNALKAQFPSARLHSGFRPGSITATGNLSYHARGRAIDVTPSMDIFNWLHGSYPNSRELIFSPAGNRQIRNGAPHMYTGITRAMHWDHVHWAMQQGGIIPSMANGGIVSPRPGGTLVRLGEAGQSEAVMPLPRDFAAGKTFNFYGDLSFPNITDPNDAETFIANLESLV